MAKKNGNQKFWIYGEDEELVARFTAYAATVLRNKRAEFIKNSKIISDHECSYDELSEAQKERCLGPSESVENIIEENELWERIRNFLPFLTPQECQVMIYLYIDHLTPAQAAQKMGIVASTVRYYKKCAKDKMIDAMLGGE
ncbi:sigma-70 family RNA polymerase sigma factor [Gemmiger sp.]